MHLLVLGQRQSYVNPSRRVFYDALARDGAVFAGPGHEIGGGRLADLAARHGPFDAVLAELWAIWPGMAEPYATHQPPDLFEFGVPVVLSALQYDLHNLQAEFFDHARRCAAVLTSVASPQFMSAWPPERVRREPWFDHGAFAVRNPQAFDERFVLMPHTLAAAEFAWTPWRSRKHDVSLLGVGYDFRRRARLHLAGRRDLRSEFLDDKLHRALARAFVSAPWAMRLLGADWLYRARFAAALRGSRVSVTCEGSIDYPIRKFFEIPAAGALLAARFFSYATELGFVPGLNCLALDDDPKSIEAVLDFALSDSVAAESMARRGQETMRALHADDRRVRQFCALVAALRGGRFVRARWRDGEFAVETE